MVGSSSIKHITRFNALAVTNINRADHSDFKRLYQLNTAAWDDLYRGQTR